MLSRREFLSASAGVLAGMATGFGLGRWLDARADARGIEGASFASTAAAVGPTAGRPLTVALLSDTHVRTPGDLYAGHFNPKLAAAVTDLTALRPDLWVCNGDVTDHGRPLEFATFQRILGRTGAAEGLLVCPGNHEFYDRTVSDDVARQRFRAAFGLPRTYSSHVTGGIHIVMLADEQWKSAPRNPDWAWLTEGQLTWFDHVLAEHRDQFTAVFLHQPLQQTVAGTYVDDGFAGSGQAAQLRAIIARNPQVRLWFSGHTHHLLQTENQAVQQGHTCFVALGSTCYLYKPQPGYPGGLDEPPGWQKDWNLSQSRVMEVWPDRVTLRARDHAHQVWLDQLEVTVRR